MPSNQPNAADGLLNDQERSERTPKMACQWRGSKEKVFLIVMKNYMPVPEVDQAEEMKYFKISIVCGVQQTIFWNISNWHLMNIAFLLIR